MILLMQQATSHIGSHTQEGNTYNYVKGMVTINCTRVGTTPWKSPNLKFFGYNIQDEKQFPKLKFQVYIDMQKTIDGIAVTYPQKWAKNLYSLGIKCLINVPYFGCISQINNFSNSY